MSQYLSNFRSYLQSIGVLPGDYKSDRDAFLLDNALTPSVPFIFWASGTMTHWEADVYGKELTPAQWNQRRWKYVREFITLYLGA